MHQVLRLFWKSLTDGNYNRCGEIRAAFGPVGLVILNHEKEISNDAFVSKYLNVKKLFCNTCQV